MSKSMLYNEEARKKLECGAQKIVDAVKLTLGPKGRNVVLERKYTTPLVTNDGPWGGYDPLCKNGRYPVLPQYIQNYVCKDLPQELFL